MYPSNQIFHLPLVELASCLNQKLLIFYIELRVKLEFLPPCALAVERPLQYLENTLQWFNFQHVQLKYVFRCSLGELLCFSLPQLPSFVRWKDSTFLMVLLWGLNNMEHNNWLEPFLECIKHSLAVSSFRACGVFSSHVEFFCAPWLRQLLFIPTAPSLTLSLLFLQYGMLIPPISLSHDFSFFPLKTLLLTILSKINIGFNFIMMCCSFSGGT